jgi:hypothetical protein
VTGIIYQDELKECPDQFVDLNCRVYKDWQDFLNNNQLSKGTYCYPRGGIYDGDINDKVIIEFGTTPASKDANVVCSALDKASSTVMVSSAGSALSFVCLFVCLCVCVCVRERER